MGLREVALGVKRWALSNRMMGSYPLQPALDVQFARTVFGQIGVPAATKILQQRGISYIGINQPDEIIVFTQKKLSSKEQRTFQGLSARIDNEIIRFKFIQSAIAQVGGPPTPPPGIPPLYIHNGRYTCGSSIYMGSEKGAGTLGALVRNRDGVLYGLSNNHVTGGSNYAVPGLPIVAPGIADVAAGGRDPETLGHHELSYPFIDGFPDVVNAVDNLDAALFKIADEARVSSQQRNYYDTPNQCIPLATNMVVEKVGRTSGHTRGTVIAELFDYEPVNCIIDVIKGYKVIFYRSLFAIKSEFAAFSYGGDSGSIIVTTDNNEKKAVGIIVAGNDEGISFALSLDRILTYFNVNLVSGHNI